jgi:hypothetical protein
VASVHASCCGWMVCLWWSDGTAGAVSWMVFLQGGQSRLHLAATVMRGSEASGSVISATNANCMALKTLSGAGALSSTMHTPPDSPGSFAKALGHCRLGAR